MFPDRSKASDGTIGDAAHQAETSDHNPRVVPALGPTPVVLAADITHDPAHGVDTYAQAEQLRVSRDLRISYVISNRRITGPNHNWAWDPYSGTDPHTNHMHVSVVANPAADLETDWSIGMTPEQEAWLKAVYTWMRSLAERVQAIEAMQPTAEVTHGDGKQYPEPVPLVEQLVTLAAKVDALDEKLGSLVSGNLPATASLTGTVHIGNGI